MAEIRDWLERFAICVNTSDYDKARTLFHDDVVGFGSHTHVVRGINYLEGRQWRMIWPHISEFAFTMDELFQEMSADGLMAVAIAPAVATGYTREGREYVRNSRATFVLSRKSVNEPLRAIHSHVSTAPGTPLRSYGPPDETH